MIQTIAYQLSRVLERVTDNFTQLGPVLTHWEGTKSSRLGTKAEEPLKRQLRPVQTQDFTQDYTGLHSITQDLHRIKIQS
jgi:hypothetical protein